LTTGALAPLGTVTHRTGGDAVVTTMGAVARDEGALLVAGNGGSQGKSRKDREEGKSVDGDHCSRPTVEGDGWTTSHEGGWEVERDGVVKSQRRKNVGMKESE
jgi:hypothetical protein